VLRGESVPEPADHGKHLPAGTLELRSGLARSPQLYRPRHAATAPAFPRCGNGDGFADHAGVAVMLGMSPSVKGAATRAFS
jgi:hypothetical protein